MKHTTALGTTLHQIYSRTKFHSKMTEKNEDFDKTDKGCMCERNFEKMKNHFVYTIEHSMFLIKL